MNAFGLFIIFGGLAVVITAIVAGAMLKGLPGAVLLVAGIVGVIAWLIFAFYIGSAMNSDI